MMGINKKIRSLRAISLAYSLIFLVIISTITIFALLPGKAEDNNATTDNLLTVHDSTYYDNLFQTEVQDSYLQFEINDSSSRTVTLTALIGGNSQGSFYRALNIPSSVPYTSVVNGTAGTNYKVTKIDLTSGYTKTGVTATNPIGTGTQWNDGRLWIRAVKIPTSVVEIKPYSFYGFACLEYFESPFVGSSRNSSAIYMDDALEHNGVSSLTSVPFHAMFSKLDDLPYSWNPTGTPDGEIESVGCDWYEEDENTYKNAGHTGYQIPKLLTKVVITDDEHLGNHALFNLKNVTTLEIGKSDNVAMKVGKYAFAESGYVNVTLPTSGVQLNTGVFSKCADLSSIVIPDGTTEIPDSAFNECVSMTRILLPSDIKKIDSLAFKDCNDLSEIAIYDSDPTNPFPHTQGYTIDLPDGLLTIGNNAFYGCHDFDKVIVPNSIETIESSAFGDCVSLTEITLPFVGKTANTIYTNVGGVNKVSTESLFGYIFGTTSSGSNSYKVEQSSPDNADQDHKDFYLPNTLKTVTITHDTRIESHAFMNCSKIENVTIEPYAPESQTQFIGANTFYGCSALTQIRVPFMGTTAASKQHFGIIFSDTLFTGATDSSNGYYVPSSLKSITVTKQPTIYHQQLYNLKYITSVTISSEVTDYIEEAVFHGNAALKYLTLPFAGCHRGIFYRHYWWWRDLAWRNTLQWVFSGTEFSGSYANDSLRYYDGYRKWIPSSLQYINITDDTTISTYAFRNFSTAVEIDVTASTIEEGCMTGCSGLTKVELPFIGRDINLDLKKSREYTFGWIFGTGEYYNSYAASAYSTWYIPKGLITVQITNKNATISNNAFANVKTLSQVHFPTDAAIASIGDYAFYNCSNLSTIDYSSAVFTKVGNYSFYGVSAIPNIDDMIPSTAVELGNYSFANTSVGGPSYPLDLSKYTKVGNYAFSNCQMIEAINITNNLDSEHLGEGVFAGCQTLSDVTLTSKTVTKNLFKDCISLEVIDCRGITVIPDGLFSGCYKLKYDMTPEDSTITGFVQDPLTSSIGEYAFFNCRSFDNYVIYASTKTINSYAFSGCTGLEYLTMPKEVVTIKPYAWKDCNPNFYFYVYEPQDQWPQGWVDNWNCNYPVYIINDTSSNLFTYKYDNEHKGYFITGTVEGVSLSGQVIFPSYHDGLKVYGVTNTGTRLDNGNYVNKISEQDGITSVVLPSSMYSIASGAFNNGHRVDVYVESTETRVNAFRTDPNIPEADSHSPEITKGWVIGVDDLDWISEGYIFYGDYWEYVNVTTNSKVPYLKASSLEFVLDFDNQTYNGYAITPNAVPAILLPAQVKVSDSSTNKTHVYHALDPKFESYNGRASIDANMWPTGYVVTDSNFTDMFSYAYTDNVNAGNAKMTASLITSRYNEFLTTLSNNGLNPIYIRGNKVQTYVINKSAISLYATSYNSVDGLPDRYKEYDQKEWKNSEWGGIVYGLPTGAVFTGTLATKSEKAGTYTFNSEPNPTEYTTFTRGDFEWTRDWKITRNGSNLTENYELYLYLEVTIEPQKVVIDWIDGEWMDDNHTVYQYGYQGTERITPKAAAYYYDPVAHELTDRVVDYCDVIAVNRSTNVGYYPSDNLYDAAAYLKDTRNFKLVNKDGDPINNLVVINDVARNCVDTHWKIVKGKVVISVNIETYLDSSDDYWKYLFDEVGRNGYNKNGIALPSGITVTGLGEGSLFSARMRTNSDDAVTYDYSSTPVAYGRAGVDGEQSRKTYFENITAPTDNGDRTDIFHIYRKTYNQSTEQYEYFDELSANYYDVFVQIGNVKILYYDFVVDYYVSKVDDTQETLVPSSSQWEINGTEKRLITSVTYRVDGQTYKLYVKTNNDNPTSQYTITYFYDQTGGLNPLTFRQVGDYEVIVHISEKHYNSYDSHVTLHAIKSNIGLKNPLEKEYDRKPIDVIADGLITKIGTDQSTSYLDNDGNPTMIVKFYNFADTNHVTEISAPSTVGTYTVYIWAKEGEFFNGINTYQTVQITKRKIYIDLSGQTTVFAENITGSKPYDATVQTFTPDSSYLLSQGYLLGEELDALGNVLYPEDEFRGVLSTGSANAGTYQGDAVLKNVDWTTQWGVYNQNGNATNNYQVVIQNSFVIEKLDFDYDPATFEHNVDVIFDNQIHYPYVEATTSRPEDASLMRIYYSNAPVNPFAGDVINPDYPKTTLRYAYSSPITTKVYYYVVCPNYNSLIGELDVIIREKKIIYNDPSWDTITEQDTDIQYIVPYDSNPHEFIVDVSDPVYATVYYSLDKVNWRTTPYSVTNCNDSNTLKIYYKIEALNYETVYSTKDNVITPIEFIVTERDLPDLPDDFTATTTPAAYDTQEHGITITIPSWYTGVHHEYYSTSYDGVDSEANWSETAITKVAAGSYDVYVKFSVPGYKTKIVKTTIVISKLTFENIALVNYSDVFDNEYHTIGITGLTSTEVKNEKDEVIAINWTYTHPTLGVIPVTVGYTSNKDATDAGYGFSEKVEYKNVGQYKIYVMVSAPNFIDLILGQGDNEGIVEILFNNSPSFEYTFKEVQYTSKKLDIKDLEIETCHDGIPSIQCWVAQENVGTGILSCDYTQGSADAIDLGPYCFKITYPATSNCAKLVFGGQSGVMLDLNSTDLEKPFFRIVPKVLEVKWPEHYTVVENDEKKYVIPYDGEEHLPSLYVETGTNESLDLYTSPSTVMKEIGSYTFTIATTTTNDNYVLDRYTITIEIRKIDLDIYIEEQKDKDGQIYDSEGPWEYLNLPLLPGHRFIARVYSNRYVTGDYYYTENGSNTDYNKAFIEWDIIKVTTATVGGQIQYTPVLDANGDYISVKDYYNINSLRVKISIVDPPMEGLINKIKVPQYDYDGLRHSLVLDFTDAPALAGATIRYKAEGEENYSSTFVPRRDAGEYKYTVQIIKAGYRTGYLETALVINQVEVKVNLAPLDDPNDPTDDGYDIYDGVGKNTTYTITNIVEGNDNSGIHNFSTLPNYESEQGHMRYYSADTITKTQLENFYKSFTPSSNIYQNALTSMTDAGTYYCVIYYYGTTTKWKETVIIEEIVVKPKDIDVIFSTPITNSKVYDGTPLTLPLSSATFDLSDLITGHTIPTSIQSLFFAKTNSANANLEINPGVFGYYDLQTGFDWGYMVIYDENNNNISKNYHPVINGNVELSITKAYLSTTEFYIVNNPTTRVYDGTNATPDFQAPDLSTFEYTYYKYDDSGNLILNPNGTPKEFTEAKDVGKYEVRVGIVTSQNYYSSQQSNLWIQGTVIINPKPVTVEWSDLTQEFNGELLKPTATITDTYDNPIPLEVYFIDGYNVTENGAGEYVRMQQYGAGHYGPNNQYESLYYLMEQDGGYTDVELFYQGELPGEQRYDITLIESPGQRKAGIYQAYARPSSTFSALSSNYSISGSTANFQINKKTYNIIIGTDANNHVIKTYTDGTTKWSTRITADDIQNFPDDLVVRGNSGTNAYLSTISYQVGSYKLQGDFDYSEIRVFEPTTNTDVTGSIEFNVIGEVVIESKTIAVDTNDITKVYSPTGYNLLSLDIIKVLNISVDRCAYTFYVNGSETPIYNDVSGEVLRNVGVYTIRYVISDTHTGDDKYNEAQGFVTVTIVKAPAFINFNNNKLSKTYDGAAVDVEAAILNNGFNGSLQDLEYTYYEYVTQTVNGVTTTNLVLLGVGSANAPVDAGTYCVTIRSTIDTVSPQDNNYEDLFVSRDYVISPRTYTLNYFESISVTQSQLNTRYTTIYKDTNGNVVKVDSNGKPCYLDTANNVYKYSDGTIATGTLTDSTFIFDEVGVITGANGDLMRYSISSVNNSVEKTRYKYQNTYQYEAPSILSTNSLQQRQFTALGADNINYNFTLSWKITSKYRLDSNNEPLDMSRNYQIVFDFDLYLHYQLLEGVVVQGVTADYDGNLKHGSYTAPTNVSAGSVSVYFSTDQNAVNTETGCTNDITSAMVGRTDPGTKTVYYKITSPNYEPVTGSYVVKVNKVDRQNITINGVSADPTTQQYALGTVKTYDGTAAFNIPTGSNYFMPSYAYDLYGSMTDNIQIGSVNITYVKTGDNIPVDASTGCVDAGIYSFILTLPETNFYKSVSLSGDFMIAYREIVIYSDDNSTIYSQNYRGSEWQINIDTSNNNLQTNLYYNFQMVNDAGALVDLPANLTVKGIIITSGKAASLYTGNGEPSLDWYNSAATNPQVFVDGVDKSENYTVLLHKSTGTYTRTAKFRINPIAMSFTLQNTTVRYNGSPQLFNVLMNTPSSASISYWNDAEGVGGWTTNISLIEKTKVGLYTIKIKIEADNYETVEFDVPFEILKSQGTATIDSILSKQYNGQETLLPESLTFSSTTYKNEAGDSHRFTYKFYELVNGSYIDFSEIRYDQVTGNPIITSNYPGISRPINAGSYKVIVEIPETENYEALEVPQEFVISPKELEITWGQDTTFEYDGTSKQIAVTCQAQGSDIIYLNSTFTGQTSYCDLAHSFVGTYRQTVAIAIGTGINETDPSIAANYQLPSSQSQYSKSFTITAKDLKVMLTTPNLNIGEFTNEFAYVSDLTTQPIPQGYYLEGLSQYDTVIGKLHIVDPTDPGQHKGINLQTGFYWSDNAYSNYNPSNPSSLNTRLAISRISDGSSVEINYNIKYTDLQVDLGYSSITPTVVNVNTIYDGQEHKPSVSVDYGSGYVIYYSLNSQLHNVTATGDPTTYGSTTLPQYNVTRPYIDANNVDTSGQAIPVYIYFQIRNSTNSTQIYNGQVSVVINRRNANLNWVDVNPTLSKTYDGERVENPQVVSDDPGASYEWEYYYLSDSTYSNRIPNPYDAGNYKLKITMQNSSNYNYTPLQMTFDIGKRNITISVTDTKRYNIQPWSKIITNDNVVNIATGDTIGAASGDLNCILQTASVNVGTYTNYAQYPNGGYGDIQWSSTDGFDIKRVVDNTSVSVKDNYNVSYNLSVSITLAKMKAIITGYSGQWDGNAHYVKVELVDYIYTDENNNIISYPKPNPSTVSVYYKIDDDTDWGAANQPKGRTNAGTSAVYIKIEAPNYEPCLITPGGIIPWDQTQTYNSYINIDGLNGNATISYNSEFIYTGDPYPSPICAVSNYPAGTGSAITYYDEDPRVVIGLQGSTTAPTNVGTYWFKYHIDQAGALKAYDEVFQFEIKPKEVTVIWDNLSFTYERKVIDDGIDPIHYSAINRVPTAKFELTAADKLKANYNTSNTGYVALDIYQKTINNDQTYSISDTVFAGASGAGTYNLVAVINDSVPNSDVCKNYTLIKITSENRLEIAKYEITNPVISDTLTTQFGDKVMIRTSSGDIFEIDYDTGKVLRYTDSEGNDKRDGNGNLIVTPDLPYPYKFIVEDGDVGTHTIKVVLTDPDNTIWDNPNNSSDIEKTYTITPRVFDPNNPTSKIVIGNYTYTWLVTGEAICPPINSVTDVSLADNSVLRTLVKDRDYTISYDNNTSLSSSNNLAKIIITGIGNYDFEIIKDFEIVNPKPVLLELKEDATIRFMIADFDRTDGAKFQEDPVATPRRDDTTYLIKNYYIGHLVPNTPVSEFVANFRNDVDKIKVYNFYGQLIFDNGAPVGDPEPVVGTGAVVELYNDSGNLIDKISCIMFGDADGDGQITAFDKTTLMSIVKNQADVVLPGETLTTPNEVTIEQYLACYTNRDSNFITAFNKAEIVSVLRGTYDLNDKMATA